MAVSEERETAGGQSEPPSVRPEKVRPLREAYLGGHSIDAGDLNAEEIARVVGGESIHPSINLHPITEAVHRIHLPTIHFPHFSLHLRHIS